MGFALGAFGGGGVLSQGAADATVPTFAGLVSVSATTARTVTVTWAAGTDDVTNPADLVYELHVSRTAGASFVVRAVSTPGATSATISDLAPETVYYVRARARDAAGNVSTDGGVELTATTLDDVVSHPTVSAMVPSPGTPLTKTTRIEFDVKDDRGLRRVLLIVTQAGLQPEVAYDGLTFRGRFAGASSVTSISGGYHFSLLPGQGGWSGSPTVEAFAFDREGFENG